VPKDLAEANRWYRQAAKQGYAAAQTNLGSTYEFGQGVPADMKQAVQWYRRAAEQGEGTSCANLARAYAEGHGVDQDPRLAYFWTLVALHDSSPLANKPSQAFVEELRGRVSGEQLTAIEKKAAEWREKHPSGSQEWQAVN
jgi:hypothetical protein